MENDIEVLWIWRVNIIYWDFLIEFVRVGVDGEQQTNYYFTKNIIFRLINLAQKVLAKCCHFYLTRTNSSRFSLVFPRGPGEGWLCSQSNYVSRPDHWTLGRKYFTKYLYRFRWYNRSIECLYWAIFYVSIPTTVLSKCNCLDCTRDILFILSPSSPISFCHSNCVGLIDSK